MNARRAAARGVLLLTLATSSASAQEASDEDLLRQGVELRSHGRDAEALEVFRRAWERSHSPRAQAQVALAEQALGRWLEAEEHLTAALTATGDPWVARTRPVLEQALGVIRQHLGRLEVEGNVPGAAVRVDGREVGTLPLRAPVRLRAGDVTLEVSAPGYYPVSRRVTIPPDAAARELVELARRAAETPAATPAPRPVAQPSTTVVAPARAPAPHSEPPAGAAQRTAGWALGGAAVLLIAGGAVMLPVGNATMEQYNDDDRCTPPGGGTREQTCSDDRRQAELLQGLGVAALVVGGAAGVASAALLLTAPRGRGRRTTWLRCGGGPGDVGIACGGAF